MKQQYARKQAGKHSGFTLLELIFVLVVAAIVTIPIYNRFMESRDKAILTEEVNNILTIAGNAQERWSNATDYAGTTETVMKNNNVFPVTMLVGAAIQNKAKGAVTCAPVTLNAAANSGLQCDSANYSAAYCTGVVQKIERIMRLVTVGTTIVKPLDGALDLVALGTACTGGGPFTVKYVVPK